MDVLELYLNMFNKVLVLCVEEKTGIRALEWTQ